MIVIPYKPSSPVNNLLGRTVLIVFAEIIQYLSYSLLTFAILFYAAFIAVLLILLQEIVFGGTLEPILGMLDRFVSVSSSIHIDNEVVLSIYGKLSLVLYLVGSLISRVFKIKLNFSLKKRIMSVALVNFFLVTPVFIFLSLRFNFFDNVFLNFVVVPMIFSIITIYIIFTVILSHHLNKTAFALRKLIS